MRNVRRAGPTRRRISLAAALLLALVMQPAMACTITSTANISLGSKTSFDARAAASNAGSGGSGIACPAILGLLSNQYVFLTVDSLSSVLTNAVTGDTIAFTMSTTPGGAPLTVGTSGNLASNGVLNLAPSTGEISLFASLSAAGNVAAGTYTGTLALKWHYATCANISAIGICIGHWTLSPGISEGCLLTLCTLTQSSLPGGGLPVTLTVTLTITKDCRFSADNVDFGSAPFVQSFNPVVGNLHITCTKGTTYSVGLGAGGASSGGRRRMSAGPNRLEYDVYRPGNTLWTSTQRVDQATPAAGSAAEVFPYEARIYADQATPPPGTYTDSLIIDVAF